MSKAEQDLFYSDDLNTCSYFRPLVDGEKGCYMSHVQIWRGLLASNDSAWIVLEDDVIPAPGFADAVNAIAKLPDGWDMVKLIGRERERILQSWPLDSRFGLISYRRVPSLTAGYVISRIGARRLLDTRVPFGRPIDVDLRLWWENGMVIRGVVPAAIALAANGGSSSIGAREDRIAVTQRWRKFVFKLRYTVANWCAPTR